MDADKNLGQAITTTEFATKQTIEEHLSDGNVYRRLTEELASANQRGFEMKMESFINRVAPHVSDAEHIFLRRGLKTRRGNMSRFYTLAKVHKFPLQLRPIVATCGTAQSALSQWLDYILQQLVPYVGTHIKDSEALRIMLTELDELPPNAYLIKADARKMYTCIDTIHGLAILRQFLEELEAQGDLPVHFNIDLIVEAAALVMRWNIFEYGDCYFQQLRGTAMGTPAAVMWSIIYYWWHEKHTLIPKYGNKLLLLKRFVDDTICIVKIGGDDGMSQLELANFKADFDNFGPGTLTWEVFDPTKSTPFLDLTITIKNGNITTSTYQKPLNLYQYIPPNSAHSRGMIKGMIYGMLQRFYRQNSNREDYWTIAMLFYNRLKNRGWTREIIEPIFIEAHSKIIQQPRSYTKPSTTC